MHRDWRRVLRYGSAAAVAAALVVTMSVQPVRALAAQWLSVFRTEKIATVQIDPTQLRPNEALRKLTPELVRKLGRVSGPEQPPHPAPVTLAVAGTIAGPLHQPVLPAGLPQQPTGIQGVRSVEYQVQPDVDAINNWLHEQGMPVRLSSRLKGQTVRVVTPALVARSWEDGHGKRLLLVEGTGLQVTGTAALDLKEVVDVLAQMAGVPADVVQQIKEIPDLGTTMVLPVTPKSGEPMRLNGNPAVYYAAPDGKSGGLVWTSGGRVYAIGGTYTREELLKTVAW